MNTSFCSHGTVEEAHDGKEEDVEEHWSQDTALLHPTTLKSSGWSSPVSTLACIPSCSSWRLERNLGGIPSRAGNEIYLIDKSVLKLKLIPILKTRVFPMFHFFILRFHCWLLLTAVMHHCALTLAGATKHALSKVISFFFRPGSLYL